MIPVSLTIKGLYSYQARQTIEFDRLLEGQLFGIFGSVGSGKSSILEAITFALYGQSERLDRNDNRNYNMMNLKSDELLIDFIFKNFDETEYRFVVRGKRHGKDFEKVNTYERTAYKSVSGSWIPLESAMADSVLGLSYDNFRRTVIIPQGKFQEFLQLGDKDRTNMLKEIFQLQKYEFSGQVSALEKRSNDALNTLKGQLLQYEFIDPEGVSAKEQYVKELESSLLNSRKETAALDKIVKEQLDLKRLFDELETERKNLEALLADEEHYQQIEKKITDYEYCIRHFKEGLNRVQELEKDIRFQKEQIKKTDEELFNCNNELHLLEQRFEPLKNEYQQLEKLSRMRDELGHIASILRLKNEIDELNKRSEKARPFIEKAGADKNLAEENISRIKERLFKEKQEMPDMNLVTQIRIWHQERKNYERNIISLAAEAGEVVGKLEDLNKELKLVLKEHAFFNPQAPQPLAFYIEQIGLFLSENKEEAEVLSSLIEQYNVQLKLGEFAESLSGGGRCPLCGSEHHPQILIIENVQEQIQEAKTQLKELKMKESAAREALQSLHRLKVKQEQFLHNQKMLQDKLDAEKSKQAAHRAVFQWEGWDKDDEALVEKAFERAEIITKNIKQLEKNLEEAEKVYKGSAADLEKYRKALNDFDINRAALTAQHSTLRQQLYLLSLSDYEHFSMNELEEKIRDTDRQISTVKKDFETLNKEIHDHQSAKVQLLERLNMSRIALEKDEKLIQKIQSELEECREKSHLKNWEEIKQLLHEQPDIDRLKARLLSYQQRCYSHRQSILKLEGKTTDKSFDLSYFEDIQARLSQRQQELQEMNDMLVKERAELAKQQRELASKINLQKNLEKLQQRAENLNTMKQLFKGSGFVNYISSVYLHNLCEAANERFYKLTRQSLRLEVTEKNEFQVRDFLNDGKVRNVKTLSGGQTFQASLSLALALAESVQHQTRSKQNFFFMDEGFGSLDKESLQTAFETLKSLRKENRMVGIISHVDDLQQEIEVYLKVTNDPIHGSRIRGSWE